MKAYLNRRYRFSASHRLHNPQMSAEENREVYGKCNNPHGHGHNYVLEVTVSGGVDPQTGMICNLADLDCFVHREIVDHYDQTNLNMLPEFSVEIPTTEKLCERVHEILQRGFKLAHLERVKLEETLMNSFEYAGEAELRK
jgi:6-pyruvoyltetrahydropterin/6-carboxytetrahydropterin synthase